MRKLFAAAFMLLLCSCYTTKYVVIKTSTTINYTRYLEKGFFITKAMFVSFDYTPVGSFSARVSDGFEVLGKREVASMVTSQGIQTVDTTIYSDAPIFHTIYDALDFAVEEAVKSGADGIIGLEIIREDRAVIESTEVRELKKYPKKVGNTYYITGMTIKRK